MKVIPVLSLLLFFQPLIAQYNWSELDRKLAAEKKTLGNNVVVLICKGDSLVYQKEMGQFNPETQALIASCSKWLTATLVMQFVEAGKLRLDDPVINYIPGFDPELRIRHCLSHMTGIADDDKFLKRILERRKYSSLEEEVNEFAKRKQRAKPGTDFWYGNIGLNIAGRVLEIVSHQKFEVLIKENLLDPLGMKATSFEAGKGGPVNPSGGARSTAADYMKFLRMILNRGTYLGRQILSAQSIDSMKLLQTGNAGMSYAPAAGEGFGYAAGSWVVEEKDGVASTLASPGLFGTWPMVDFCRGYAYLVFVKNWLGEERANIHQELKAIIDRQFQNDCD